MRKLLLIIAFAIVSAPLAEAGILRAASFPVRHPKAFAKGGARGAKAGLKGLFRGAKKVLI